MGDAQAIIEERESAHGPYGEQAALSQKLKFIVREEGGWLKLSNAERESVDMIIVKISRILHGNPDEPDHWKDIAGYATLISNIIEKGHHL